MKIEVFNGNWNLELVKSNPDKLYVFGDNNLRIGKGGQASIRDAENSIGIRTKKGPSNKSISFFSDLEFEKNVDFIREDILNIKLKILSGEYKTIVLSKNGYGTGLAKLEKFAPQTFSELCLLLLKHFNFENRTGIIKRIIPGYDQITNGSYISIDNKSFNSNVLSPVNNSLFSDYLLSLELNTYYDIISKEKKLAFTYPIKNNYGDIVIFSSYNCKKYLVCRVVDSYDFRFIDKYKWSFFEGFSEDFIKNAVIDENKILYQNHIEFICDLDESGNMIFKQDLFL